MTSTAATSDIAEQPLIRSNQFGALNQDSILRSVNVFRGDVNLPLPFVTLQGRNGLDLSVTAQYQSNVSQEVTSWNRDQPTSVLGVGWSLDIERIFVGNRETATGYDASYFLSSQGNTVPLYRLGEDGTSIAFEALEFVFWKIRYFPDTQQPTAGYWEITKNDGSIWRFGGTLATEVGIEWDNWVGATVATNGTPFPIAWNLATVTSIQNDVLSFTYEMDQVEIGSARFTLSSRLSTITDVFSRVVTFFYVQKQDSEIQLPFTSPYNDGTTAYQFSYETKYLDRVDISSANGTLLFRQLFSYALYNLDPSGQADPNFNKRYLTSICQQMPEGDVLPGVNLTYDFSTAAVNPGALIGVQYPLGAQVSYSYTSLASIQSSSKIQIVTPTQDYTPGIWHGSDYTVVTFYNSYSKQLQIQVYSWGGVWLVWDGGLVDDQIDHFEIHTGVEFFALVYQNERNQSLVKVYRHNDYRPMEWDVSDCSVDNTTAELSISLGEDFLAFQSQDASTLIIYQWMALTRTWERQQLTSGVASSLALGSGMGFVLGAYYDESREQVRLQSFYRDASRQWHAGQYVYISQSIDWSVTQPNSVWSIGASIASATFITAVSEQTGTISSSVTVLRWHKDFSLTSVDTFQLQQSSNEFDPTAYSVLSGSLVGHAENVLRYNPSNWLSENIIGSLSPDTTYQYAYGDNLALAVSANTSGQSTSSVSQEFSALRFDPYQQAWSQSGVPYTSPRTASTVLKPSVSGNYATLGRDIFFQNADSTWSNIGSLPFTVNGESIQLSGSAGYLLFQTDGSSDTLIKFFKNGQVDSDFKTLTDESGYDASGTPGTVLAGPSSFVTYRGGSSLAEAREIYLYKVTDGALPDYLVATPVQQVVLDDGYTISQFSFTYDQDTASFNSTGLVAQYQTIQIAAGNSSGAYGTSVRTYFSGLAPDSEGAIYPDNSAFTNVQNYYGLLAGQLYRTDTFCASARGETSVINSLFVYNQLQTGTPIAGIYVVPSKSEKISYLSLFELPESDSASLNQALFSDTMVAEFAAQGIVFTVKPLVTVLKPDVLWRLDDETGNLWYIENTGSSLTVFGGVVESTEYTTNTKGQTQSQTLINYDSNGAEQRLTTEYTYGWEVYPDMVSANLLNPVVQVLNRNASAELITGIQTTTWSTVWASAGNVAQWGNQFSYQWIGLAGTEVFDFDASYTQQNVPTGWICTDAVIDRNAQGSILESRDISGIPSSTLFDATGLMPVARFQASSISQQEASYYGFMPYEAADTWQTFSDTQNPSALIQEGDAYTGTHALVLSGNPTAEQGVRASFAPTGSTHRYRISCRIKTYDASGSGSINADDVVGAGITIVAEASDTGASATHVFPFPLTGNQWGYFQCTFDAETFSLDALDQFTVTIFNHQTGLQVLVDDIFLTPFNGIGDASIYDSDTLILQARCGSLGDSSLLVYNRLKSPISEINRYGKPKQLTAQGTWRSQSSLFDPATPNASLSAKVRSGGSFANFWHGNEYLNDWTATPDWTIQAGRLVYSGSGTGTLSAKEMEEIVQANCLALRCSIRPEGILSLPFGFSLTGSLTVQWNASAWELLDGTGQLLSRVLVDDWTGTIDCLLIISQRSVLFYVDGWQLIAYLFDAPVTGTIQVFSAAPISLSGLTIAADPIVTLQYQTNSGQGFQEQALEDDGIRVQQICFDHLAQPAIQTKTVRFTHQLFAFRQAFVTDIDWDSGVISGEVATAYPDDEGYPYTRSFRSNTPAAQVIEQGLPGKILAIDSQTPEHNKTTKFIYHSNVQSGLGADLPAGKYFIKTSINQNGVEASELTDCLGRTLWTSLGSDSSLQNGQFTRTVFDDYGNPVLIEQPNFFEPDRADSAHFVIQQEFDFFKRCISHSSPDATAPTLSVYDNAGRLRFQCDANGTSEGYSLYWTYDFLGRVLEQGVSDSEWDQNLFEQHANDPLWVPGTANWARRYTYDGDGSDVNTIGNIWSVTTRNGSTDTDDNSVTEVLSYDGDGQIIQRVQIIQGVDSPNGQTALFTYNQLGNITRIQDAGTDDTASTQTIRYEFNVSGQVSSVLLDVNDQPSQRLAAYTYQASGAVDTETFVPGTTEELVRRFTYNSPGWVNSITDPFFSQTLSYFEGGYNATANYTGLVSNVRSVFSNVPATDEFITDSTFSLAYDAQSRLTIASSTATPAGTATHASLGTLLPLNYDANGNLLELSRGSTTQSYAYNSGSNQLNEVVDGPEGSYFYNADGQLITSQPRAISDIVYDPALSTTLSMETTAGQRTFRYGENNVRLGMAASGGQLSLMLSNTGKVLWQNTIMDGAITGKTLFVYGPTGLIAARSSAGIVFALKDSLMSIRGFYDGQTLCAAYNYQPLGEFMGAIYETGALPGTCHARFTSQPLDPETGLYFFPARPYDPYLGRFYGIDPAGQYPSPYLYANGDPFNRIDPTGMLSWAAIGAIIGGVAVAAVGAALIFSGAGAAGGAALGAYAAAMIEGAAAAEGASVAISATVSSGILAGGTVGSAGSAALLGAGTASLVYGASHTTGKFESAEFGTEVGLGALFGTVGAGEGAFIDAVAGSSMIAKGGMVLAVGTLDGYVSNGISNTVSGDGFNDNAGFAAVSGGVAAGVTFGLGSFATSERFNPPVRRTARVYAEESAQAQRRALRIEARNARLTERRAAVVETITGISLSLASIGVSQLL